jgi:hypothetical protein
MRRALWALAPLLAACGPDPGLVQVLPPLDLDGFAQEVGPILEARCANPTCHGNPDRPLSLYAVHLHRLDPADVHRDTPLTAVEVWSNYQQARAMAEPSSDPWTAPLVSKPLADRWGGGHHVGGEIFEDPYDAECAALIRWIEGSAGTEETP